MQTKALLAVLALPVLVLTAACDSPKTDATTSSSGSKSNAPATTSAPATTAKTPPAATPPTTGETTIPPTSTAPSDGAPAAEAKMPDGPPIKIVAMKLKSSDPKNKEVVEIKPDGTLTVDGKVMAKIVANHLEDDKGKPIAAVDKAGNIVVLVPNNKAPHFKFDDKDNLVADDGTKIAISDDGKLTLLVAGKPSEEGKTVTIEGFKPEGRRALGLFMLTLFMMSPVKSQEAVHATPAIVTATSATPPATTTHH